MKRGTGNLLKFKRLQRRLDRPLWQIKGLLQSIWDVTAENAPHGDIGRRMTVTELFGEIQYEGDPEDTIDALVETGWLDRDDEHVLLVHDWADHAEEWVKKVVSRTRRPMISRRQSFPSEGQAADARPTRVRRASTASETGNGRAADLLTMPNHAMPHSDHPEGDQRAHLNGSYAAAFDAWWAKYPRKVAKGRAAKAYKLAVPKVGHDRLLERVTAYAAVVARWSQQDRKEFCPHPATWLNDERWDDDPADWSRKVKNGAAGNGSGVPDSEASAAILEERRRAMAAAQQGARA